MSGYSCGCDPEAGWVAEHCKGPEGCLSQRCKLAPMGTLCVKEPGHEGKCVPPATMRAALAGVDEHQQAPETNDRPAIQDLVIADVRSLSVSLSRQPHIDDESYGRVIADIEARKQIGLERYGTLLQAFNGRDALLDAYQEVLDLVMYLRQVKEEGSKWIEISYANAIGMALHLRTVIEDRNHEAGSDSSLGNPARGV